jgi:RHS repeat-associated protein
MMAEGWITASYNALNQPIAIWVPGYGSNFMWFGYDPLGRCVKRWMSDSGDVYSNPATYFNYDGWNLLQDGNNAWGPARFYVHGNRMDEIVWSYNTSTGDQAFHHYDARGHCTLVTDSSGNILEQYEYDAFGQPYFYDAGGNSIGAYDAQGRWAGYSLFGNRFLFTGREWLSDVKLYDYRARMYQPELGRFLQPDPKQFAAGDYNLYRYCHNDPVNRTDPTGLQTFMIEIPPVLIEAEIPRPIIERATIPREMLDQAVRLNEGRNRVPLPDGRTVDLRGRSHFDKATQQRIPTPHVHEPKAPFKPPFENMPTGRNPVPRPAKPDDIKEVIRHLLDKLKKE